MVVCDGDQQKSYRYSLEGDFMGTDRLPNIYFNDIAETDGGDRFFSVTAYQNEFDRDTAKAALVVIYAGDATGSPDATLLQHPAFRPNKMP